MKLFAVCLAASAAAPTNSDILDWGNVSWNVRHTKNDIALKLFFCSTPVIVKLSIKTEHKITNFALAIFRQKITFIRYSFVRNSSFQRLTILYQTKFSPFVTRNRLRRAA